MLELGFNFYEIDPWSKTTLCLDYGFHSLSLEIFASFYILIQHKFMFTITKCLSFEKRYLRNWLSCFLGTDSKKIVALKTNWASVFHYINSFLNIQDVMCNVRNDHERSRFEHRKCKKYAEIVIYHGKMVKILLLCSQKLYYC